MNPFEKLAALKANWDTYGAPPITPAAIETAKWLHSHWPTASVVPTPTGGVQLETEALEIEIGADGLVVGALLTYADGRMVELAPEAPLFGDQHAESKEPRE